MKPQLNLIMIAGLVLGCFSLMNAQEVTANVQNVTLKEEGAASEPVTVELAEMIRQKYMEHSISARQQISAFMADHVTYPEEMKYGQKEGTVIVKLFIDRSGQIAEAEIAESLSPVFDSLVLDALSRFSSVSIDEEVYQGARKMLCPVLFTLD